MQKTNLSFALVFIATFLSTLFVQLSAQSPLGTNLPRPNSWSTYTLFVDAMKRGNGWLKRDSYEDFVPSADLTADGYLKAGKLGQTFIFEGYDIPKIPSGDYVLLYEGIGDFYFDFCNCTIKEKAAGRWVINVPDGMEDMVLVVTANDINNPIRNLRLIMPGFEHSYQNQPFHPDFLQLLAPFNVLRFMEIMQINGSDEKDWRNRRPGNYLFQGSTIPNENGIPQKIGMSVEWMVSLANRLNVHPWFCIPHQATDDWVRQFAIYIKTHLKKDLQPYIEYTNESWNGIFPQTNYIKNLPALTSIPGEDIYEKAAKYHARRSVEIFKIWEKIYDNCTDPFVRVMGGWADVPEFNETRLQFENTYLQTDVLAIAPYFGWRLNEEEAHLALQFSVPDILNFCQADIEGPVAQIMQKNAQICREYDVDLVAYEGGQHLVSGVDDSNDRDVLTEKFIAANRHSTMKNLYTNYLNQWKKAGGQLFVNFTGPETATHFGSWGMMEHQWQPLIQAPKYEALVNWQAANPQWWSNYTNNCETVDGEAEEESNPPINEEEEEDEPINANETPQPSPPINYQNTANFNFAQQIFQFHYAGPDGNMTYEYRPQEGGSLGAIHCLVEGIDFVPSNRGGFSIEVDDQTYHPWSAGVQWRLKDISSDDNVLYVLWNMEVASTIFEFEYVLYLEGRTLVIQLSSEDNKCTNITFDRSEQSPNPIIVPIPYMPWFNVLLSNNLFTSLFFDWEKSNAGGILPLNRIFSEQSAYYAQFAEYLPLTNGQRNQPFEVAYLTVSPNFDDVLPNIPNPVSPYKKESAEKLIWDVWDMHFAQTATYMNILYEMGIDNLWIVNHVWQHAGYDSGYPDVMPPNVSLGGMPVLTSLINQAYIYDYTFAVHENYADMYPNSPSFFEGELARRSDNSLIPAWYNPTQQLQSYAIKPFVAEEFQATYSPAIHNRLNTNAGFLDVHSAVNPSFRTDYDASVPNAGKVKKTIASYKNLGIQHRDYHHGPVSGEGNFHFLYAGYYDDAEAQINTGKGAAWSGSHLPLMPTFKLKKIHPLMTMHGVGYYNRFFSHPDGSPNHRPFPMDSVLIYIATELAYANGGFIPSPGRIRDFRRTALLEHQYVLPVQLLLYNAKPISILFNDHGNLISNSTYLKEHPHTFDQKNHADFMSQLQVVYDNGVIVQVNRHPFSSWEIAVPNSRDIVNCHVQLDNEKKLHIGDSFANSYSLPAKNGWLITIPRNLWQQNGLTTNLSFRETLPKIPLEVFPNPIKNMAYIRYQLPTSMKTRLRLVNLVGKEVQEIQSISFKKSGWHRLNLSTGKLPTGLYFLLLESKEAIQSKKIVIK